MSILLPSTPFTFMRSASRTVGWFVLCTAILFSIGYFRGLETHTAYCGNAYQALHPSSFPGDPFMSPTRPAMLSLLYYGIIPLFGDVWLDDRFTLLIFIGIALASFAGLDRIARLLGAGTAGERIAILSLMLFGHPFLRGAHVMPIHNAEFNGSTFAGPLAMWLLSHSLAGHRLWMILLLMGLLCLTQVKVFWMPALIAWALVWQRLRGRQRLGWLVAALGGVAAVVWWYYHFKRPAGDLHVVFFDYILHYSDLEESHPFMNPWWQNALLVTLLLVGLRLKGLEPFRLHQLKIIAVIGLLVWLVGGLYLSWAPHAIKIPHLVLLNVTRALAWPQLVLYTAFGVLVLKRLQRAHSTRELVISWILFMVLFLHRGAVHLPLIAVVLFTTIWMLVWQGNSWPLKRLERSTRVAIVAVSVAIANLAQVTHSLYQRREALAQLAQDGIMGDNPSAKWVGVNAFIRNETSPRATWVAFSESIPTGINRFEEPTGLEYDPSLRVRTGRSMPLGHVTATYFDVGRLALWEERRRTLEQVRDALRQHRASDALESLAAVGWPDYLIAPSADIAWLSEAAGSTYQHDTSIGQLTILKRRTTP